ncbi:MrcB family domain-containing protein [Chitinophaga sp. HK235]|uniref:MrcB family domain-containing protein n=1 Tax=Chitinophaga sp. HK235 TaxID=2952571 RepID=UPI001BA8A6F6|nr:DUF3578 domain-containing protein [Chitinophaga sp. HK235]
MLQELFSEFISIYPGEKNSVKNGGNRSYGHLRSTKILTEILPKALQEASGLSTEQYLSKGSVGKGIMAEVPHLSILDKTITTSPEEGYYIVYLFDSRMTKFYLVLLQGWTQFENAHGPRIGKRIILKNKRALQEQFSPITNFSTKEIDLLAERTRTKGYRWGTVFSQVYFIDEMPTDQMIINDLQKMVGVYSTMKEVIGPSIVNITIPTEEDFQDAIQDLPPATLPDGPIAKPSQQPIIPTKWPRSERIASKALLNANYKCEVDNRHQTFKSGKTKKPFVEAHHLIPISLQDGFRYSIDVPENIIALCPNCHRAFHHGENAHKKDLVKRFFQERKINLHFRGIEIDEKTLIDTYIKDDYFDE